MRRIVIPLLALCALALAATALANPPSPDALRLGPPEGMEAGQPLVDFPHGRHAQGVADCITCHHPRDDKSDIRSCRAPGCHDQPGKKGETAFYAAFHARKTDRSCLGCHKAEKKVGKAVPVSCSQCHKK